MPITLNGSTSGQVTIQAPAVAGTTALTLPSSSGTLARTADIPAAYTDSDALSLFNASGSAPVYACRAWVNFNGTGTVAIRASGNVTSITDNGTGDYTINFTTAMSDANYAIYGSVYEASGNNSRSFGGATTYSLASGSARINTNSSSGFSDYTVIAAAVMR